MTEPTKKIRTLSVVKTTLISNGSIYIQYCRTDSFIGGRYSFIIQLIYYFGLYNRIHAHNKAVRKEEVHFSRELPPLSVILCARNEAENLRKILPAILEQDYPQFEVIVINDASTDETEDILGMMEENNPHLYHSFTLKAHAISVNKKLALTLGH